MIDWTDAFDNSGYISDAADHVTRWPKDAAAFRADHPPERITTGDHPREWAHLFHPAGTPKGLLIFVHGGYWMRFDASDWSHLACGALKRGWAVALPSYPLAPERRIAEITASVRRSVGVLAESCPGPVHLAGHSAGGHLVTRIACDPPTDRIARVVSISGLHDLRPLRGAGLNETLMLDQAEAETESPALHPPPTCRVTAWVGAQERPEFLRQSRLLEESWQRQGALIDAHYAPGHHHFSVVEPLMEPDSDLTRACLNL
ncbi:MAG: alpha/beta hydrolase [Shimia sp.]